MLRRISISLIIALLAMMISACSKDHTLIQTRKKIVIKPRGKVHYDYRIKPNDRVAVTVYKYPDYTPTNMSEKGILVDENGYISLPLIHRVHIAGCTQSEASRKLEKMYAKYLKDPALNLEVLNKRAYILGEVKKPGPVAIDGQSTTIFQALAAGGGLTEDAQRDRIMILTHDAYGNLELRRLDLRNYITVAASDLTIKPNDVIYVSPSAWKEFRINSENFSSVFKIVSDVASPFVTLKYLFND